MNTEELLQKGIKAATLLNNEDLMAFIEAEKQLLLQSISNTQPHEVKTRESRYCQIYAINDFIDGLRQYVTAAEEVVNAANKLKETSD